MGRHAPQDPGQQPSPAPVVANPVAVQPTLLGGTYKKANNHSGVYGPNVYRMVIPVTENGKLTGFYFGYGLYGVFANPRWAGQGHPEFGENIQCNQNNCSDSQTGPTLSSSITILSNTAVRINNSFGNDIFERVSDLACYCEWAESDCGWINGERGPHPEETYCKEFGEDGTVSDAPGGRQAKPWWDYPQRNF
jgi:hypothetical protein